MLPLGPLLAAALSQVAPAPPPPADSTPSGLVLTAALGGGASLNASAEYARSGLFEGELGVGYELPLGVRPEVAFVLGAAPQSHVGLRPGLHVALPDVPLYVRAAADWSTVTGSGAWRWVLLGGGGELRVTDVLGAFAEVDFGVPLRDHVGLGTLVRAGVSFRF